MRVMLLDLIVILSLKSREQKNEEVLTPLPSCNTLTYLCAIAQISKHADHRKYHQPCDCNNRMYFSQTQG